AQRLPQVRTDAQGEESKRYRNNILSYVVDYVALGGVASELADFGVDMETIEREVGALEPTAEGNPARLDTCARVYHFLGETEKARACALVLSDLLQGEESVRLRYRPEDILVMRETVRALSGSTT